MASEVGSGTGVGEESTLNAAPETVSVEHPGNGHGPPLLETIVIFVIRSSGAAPSRGSWKYIKT